MTFGEAIRSVWSQYAVFKGRARRSEFWWWALLTFLIDAALQAVLTWTGTVYRITYFPGPTGQWQQEVQGAPLAAGNVIVLVLSGLITLGLLLPSLAVAVRRLHDTGRSGWWLLIALVPLVGVIVLLVFYLIAGSTGTNAYGVDPKALEHDVRPHDNLRWEPRTLVAVFLPLVVIIVLLLFVF